MADAAPPAITPVRPTRLAAFGFWLKLGFISFGGPAGQIALMHHELVERRRWISEQRFLHALNYCMLMPGPEAIQLAIYISWLMHGIGGAVMAGVLFFLPAFVLLSLLAGIYLHFGDLPLVQGIFLGIKPAVVALVLFAAWRIGQRTLTNAVLASIAVLSFFSMFALKIDFPWIVGVAAILGVAGGKYLPHQFETRVAPHGPTTVSAPAIIDDDTPPPPHARFSSRRFAITLAMFTLLWSGAMWLVSGSAELVRMGEFFTKAAFLTIGGAYAVLPYVYQGAVEQFGWLSGPQMMAGLALGETTPGPLIMIVTWVGYIGGVAKEVSSEPLAAGMAGAATATFFTFLPSFLFIIAGGPLVEATRGELRYTAPLTAITAAVVGVIINLCVFFAWHTFWPDATATEPLAGPPDVIAVAVAIVAFVALWKYQVDALRVIGTCALLGLARIWFG